jgi:hypothetical protein
LLDERPHPNQREHIESLIRDISWGTGISSDLLWNISNLGGANTRYVMADAQVYVQTEQQDLVDTWLNRDWVYHCAKEMKAGRLRACEDPEWWKHGWVTPERVTVDFGRDGRVILDKWKSMLLSTERIFSMAGQDAREEMSTEIELVKWFKDKLSKSGLSMADFSAFRSGSVALPVPMDPASEPEPAAADQTSVENKNKPAVIEE